MKNLMLIPLVVFMSLTACKKEEENTTVNEEDAVETITKSMESDNAGLSEQMTESAEMVEVAIESPCGEIFDTTINKSYSSSTRNLDYTFNWTRTVNCTVGIPSSISFNYSSSGTYEVPRIKSNDNASGEIVFTQLLPSETEYLVTIDYTRNGTEHSKVGRSVNFTSTITATGSDITINKDSYEITGGSISITISGASDTDIAFSYGGTMVFNGGGSATITLNNGSVYEVSV